MSKFSSYGQIQTHVHYYAPRTELIDRASTRLLGETPDEGGHYITVWAPRQTGKSSVMLEVVKRLKGVEQFEVAIITLESAKNYTDEAAVLEMFKDELSLFLGRELPEQGRHVCLAQDHIDIAVAQFPRITNPRLAFVLIQRVYAAGGDLTVIAPVNSGAELMADGHIHVYAPMRGRAIAGLHGDTKARIFCADLQAELVSVAGHYRVSDSIPAELKGCRTQVFLDHEVLRIEPL
mgnify:CR=1 FL=1